MNKAALRDLIIASLSDELAHIERAAAAAREGATHTESTAEDRYDTRGLEASYLAGAQTARAADLRKTVGVFRAWTLDSFGPEDVIRPGALVELETEGGPAFYLLAHVGGGVRVDWEGRAVSVVTPSSPIGSGIVGAEEGDDFQLVLGGQKKAFEIVGVW